MSWKNQKNLFQKVHHLYLPHSPSGNTRKNFRPIACFLLPELGVTFSFSEIQRKCQETGKLKFKFLNKFFGIFKLFGCNRDVPTLLLTPIWICFYMTHAFYHVCHSRNKCHFMSYLPFMTHDKMVWVMWKHIDMGVKRSVGTSQLQPNNLNIPKKLF